MLQEFVDRTDVERSGSTSKSENKSAPPCMIAIILATSDA